MGWSIGFDSTWNRDIGYGVPAYCDHPGCTAEIDRGLGCVCGSDPHGGDHGCGLYFCGKHLAYTRRGYERTATGRIGRQIQLCARCRNRRQSFDAKPDHPRWIAHKLTDSSWHRWRIRNAKEVAAMRAALVSAGIPPIPLS